MRIQLRVYIKEWNTYKTYLTYDDVKNFIHQAKKWSSSHLSFNLSHASFASSTPSLAARSYQYRA